MEKRVNSGVLFKNNRKQEGSNQPDYSGTGNWQGQDFQISAWLKEGKNGKFFSFSFQEPYVPGEDKKPRNDEPDSEIPF